MPIEIDGLMPRECVKCGYCCREGVCPYGEWGDGQCIHLTEENECNLYEWITSSGGPVASISPAFGAGCGSPMNDDRMKTVLAILDEKE